MCIRDRVKATAVSAVTYGIVSCWMYVIGMGAAIITGEYDIAQIMLKAGLGILGLLIIVFSTVTTTFLDAYSAGISSETVVSRWNGKHVAIVVTVICLLYTSGGGILTGKYRELKEYGVDDNRNRFYPYFKEPLFSKVMLLLRTMDQISVERNVPLSQIALNWTLQRPFISSCIIGAQSRDKIEENCKVFEWKLSDDEMQLLSLIHI